MLSCVSILLSLYYIITYLLRILEDSLQASFMLILLFVMFMHFLGLIDRSSDCEIDFQPPNVRGGGSLSNRIESPSRKTSTGCTWLVKSSAFSFLSPFVPLCTPLWVTPIWCLELSVGFHIDLC
jgi:hypothetical protein